MSLSQLIVCEYERLADQLMAGHTLEGHLGDWIEGGREMEDGRVGGREGGRVGDRGWEGGRGLVQRLRENEWQIKKDQGERTVDGDHR
jgi:hypothetical protein